MTTTQTHGAEPPAATIPATGERAGIPDLTTYRQVHRAMRVANEQLVVALTDIDSGDIRRAEALRRWFVGYSGELLAHHGIEDDLFFPALAERVPASARHATVLDDDHHRLDVLIDALRVALGRMSGGTPDRHEQLEALTLATELRDLMARHLDTEDVHLLPMFERHFTADEYATLDAEALKRINVRQALFTVPWWMATAEPEAAARTLLEAPLPLKVIYRLTRGRYAALVQRAFHPASVTPRIEGGQP